MKRLLNLVFVFVVGLLIVLPFTVKAAGEITYVKGDTCKEPDAEGYCYTEIILGMKNNTGTLDKVEIEITFASSEVVYGGFESQNGWENMGSTSIANKAIKLELRNASGDFSGATTTFGTFKYKYPSTLSDADCSAYINGVNVTTTTETTTETTTTTETVENPKTGVSLPIVILISGLAVAGVVYYVSKKNTKMYKI